MEVIRPLFNNLFSYSKQVTIHVVIDLNAMHYHTINLFYTFFTQLHDPGSRNSTVPLQISPPPDLALHQRMCIKWRISKVISISHYL